MTYWFYATLSEPAAWFNTAVRARSAAEARAKLLAAYPHARIIDLSK